MSLRTREGTDPVPAGGGPSPGSTAAAGAGAATGEAAVPGVHRAAGSRAQGEILAAVKNRGLAMERTSQTDSNSPSPPLQKLIKPDALCPGCHFAPTALLALPGLPCASGCVGTATTPGGRESARPLWYDLGLNAGHCRGMLGLGSSPAPTASPRSAEADKQGFIIFHPPAQCRSYSADFATAMIQTRPLRSSLSRFSPACASCCTGDGQSLLSPRTESNVLPVTAHLDPSPNWDDTGCTYAVPLG